VVEHDLGVGIPGGMGAGGQGHRRDTSENCARKHTLH
jgi:hypothetical protein